MTRDDFFRLAPPALPTAVVGVPGLGDVTVRGLSAAEWDEYERACTAGEGDKVEYHPDRARLVQFGCVGEDGRRLFTPADHPKLSALPLSVAGPLARRIQELSGFGADPGKASSPTPGGG